MNKRKFYEEHINFSWRSITEYFLSPGIRCKFDLIKENLNRRNFSIALDLGCSGNSFIYFLENIVHKSFYDIALTPLHQYAKILEKKSEKKNLSGFNHPLCGDITYLPYRDNSFDFISILDVLEHIKNDELAISELSRILKGNGIVIVTVPHRMDYYSKQDQLIGHYRRYEIDQLISLFRNFNLQILKIFGVYGRIMKISDIQSASPEKTEKSLQNLRYYYTTNNLFRKIWNIFVDIGAFLMKLDARSKNLSHKMNLAFIFKKQIKFK